MTHFQPRRATRSEISKFALALTLLFASTSHAQEDQVYMIGKHELKGPIKTIEQKVFKADGKQQAERGDVFSAKLNEFSQLDEVVIQKRNIWYREIYRYLDNGKLAGEKVEKLDQPEAEEGARYIKRLYQYDDEGQLEAKEEWTYNNDRVPPDWELKNDWKYEYNDQGQLTKEVRRGYIIPQIGTFTNEFEYTESGEIWKTTHSKGKKETGSSEFVYNKKGQLEMFTASGFDENYKYNKAGQLIEKETSGKIETYEYNNDGQLAGVYEEGSKKSKIPIHKYTAYDKYGNWTEREDYNMGQLWRRYKRTITYYVD